MISVKEVINNMKDKGVLDKFNIEKCVDIGDKYAFYLGLRNSKKELPIPGMPIICIDKLTGELSELTIPPLENIEVLNSGIEIDVQQD